ncbi:unnamed protein product, partial [Staurois parvus]
SVAPAVPPVSVHQYQLSVLISTTCSAHQCHINATYQCSFQCQSVPPINANQCHLSVPPISASLSVPTISAHQCRLSVPISADYQCPSV